MLTAPLACLWVVGVQSVAEVPSPRPTGWVTDQADVLDAATEARLNEVAEALHRELGPEVAVVTIDDSPGDPKQFATELFNTWHIGRAGADDGVLVLMVMGKRRLEIETGVGVDIPLPAAWLADMQAAQMVPAFKRRDIGGGLIAGLVAIDARLRGLPVEADVPSTPGEYRSDGTVVTPGGTTSRPAVPATGGGGGGGGGDDDGGGGALGYGLGALAALGAGGAGVVALRRRRRRCAACQVQMLALDELADDAHLSAGQQAEERLGAVDYEVLICPGCQASKTIVHNRWFSGRQRCPGCRFKTAKSTSRTLVTATYDHGGSVEITVQCPHCNHRSVSTRSTPRRTRPSSTSTSSGSRSYGSSSSRSSSSSSRSSSGFGGGRSRGGGAGSSW
ncbi:MAG: TPM domain-containing protein [Myxococcales bacterium]|nr:TPM domain-containing protein [Myxococcales bacterium]